MRADPEGLLLAHMAQLLGASGRQRKWEKGCRAMRAPLIEGQMDQAAQHVADNVGSTCSAHGHTLHPAPTPGAGPHSSRVPTCTSFSHPRDTGEQPVNLSRGPATGDWGRWAAKCTGRWRRGRERWRDRVRRPQGPEEAMFAGEPKREGIVPTGFSGSAPARAWLPL